MSRRLLLSLLVFSSLLATLAASLAEAGSLRERWEQRAESRRADHHEEDADREDDGDDRRARLPAGARLLRDISYGPHPLQRLDVYLPAQADKAPVIVMVHGGGWRRGDKDSAAVVDHKAARWLPRGIVVVSVNYRLLPDTPVAQQAEDVARALAHVQRHADDWGGDGRKVVLMGHSAGAHLASLLAADPEKMKPLGLQPWLGTVALDSAAVDVEAVMRRRHLALYDQAFGRDPAYWRRVSPLQQYRASAAPLLLACSSTRRDKPCAQAKALADKARTLGTRVEVLPLALSHREINVQLGKQGTFTDAVEHFLASLDTALAARLGR